MAARLELSTSLQPGGRASSGDVLLAGADPHVVGSGYLKMQPVTHIWTQQAALRWFAPRHPRGFEPRPWYLPGAGLSMDRRCLLVRSQPRRRPDAAPP